MYYWLTLFIVFPIAGIFLIIYGYAMTRYIPYVEIGIGFIGIPFIILGTILLVTDVWIIIRSLIKKPSKDSD